VIINYLSSEVAAGFSLRSLCADLEAQARGTHAEQGSYGYLNEKRPDL
jgi:hypothetical protein